MKNLFIYLLVSSSIKILILEIIINNSLLIIKYNIY